MAVIRAATRKPRAERLSAGRYAYRTYLIEEISHDAGETKPRWNISLLGTPGAVDAAGTLREAKAMIDGWQVSDAKE